MRNKNEMNDLELEIRSKYTTWSKKFDRNVRLGVRNQINVRHGVRNKKEMNDLE